MFDVLEDIGRHTTAFLHQTEQNVLGADVLVVQSLGFLACQSHDFPGPIGKPVKHALSLF